MLSSSQQIIFTAATWAISGLVSTAFAQEISWYEITNGEDTKVGYAKREVITKSDIVQIVNTRYLFGKNSAGDRKTSNTKVTEIKDRNGTLKEVRLKTGKSKATSTTTLRLEGSIAHIQRKTLYGEQSYSLPLPSQIRFDFGEALLKDRFNKGSPRLEFDNFNIVSLRPERVIIETAPIFGPDKNIYIRKSYDETELRSVAILTLDENGQVTELSQPTLKAPIIRRLTNKTKARKRSKSQKPQDIIALKSPYKISKKALSGKIRYIFSYKYDLNFTVPETRDQRVMKKDNLVALDICNECGLEEILSEAEKAKLLMPSVWIQSDRLEFQKAAQKVLKKTSNKHETMVRLGKRARQRLKKVNFAGHYSAAEAWKRRAGDCTEDAVTLAALGRAANIPTRIVSGLVYSRERYHGVSNVFVPHSWTQAWFDGRWHNYDISMDGFDASHIILATGEGDPAMISAGHQLGSLLKLEKMVSVKSRKTGDRLGI